MLFSVSPLHSFIYRSHRYTSNIENLKRHPAEDFLTPSMCALARSLIRRYISQAFVDGIINLIDVLHFGRVCCVRDRNCGRSLLCTQTVEASHIKSHKSLGNWNLFLIIFGVSEYKPKRIDVKVHALPCAIDSPYGSYSLPSL